MGDKNSILNDWDAGGDGSGTSLPPPPPPSGDPWEDAPFTCLGKAGTTYYFLDESGHVVDMPASRFGQWSMLVTLCGRHGSDWLQRHFPRIDEDGTRKAGFAVQNAAVAIMARSAAMPTFDPDEPQRRYGAWPVTGGGVALHLGDRVIWKGRERRAGFRDDAALWVALSPRPAPAEVAAGHETGARFEQLLGGWNWKTTAGPALFLGLITAGVLAGLLSWRTHSIVVGEAGSGKTTLLRLMLRYCPLLAYQNSFTEPGLRWQMTASAVGLILDEAESDAGGEGRLTRVIEMLRRASSDGGLQHVQAGAPGGGAVHFHVNATAMLGLTLPPALNTADASRFTVLHLAAATGPGGDVALADFLDAHGLALWARAVAQAPRMLALFRGLQAELQRRGSSAREADQLATIAACRWVMVRPPEDDPVFDDPEVIDGTPLEPVLALRAKAEDRLADSSGAMAFVRLLSMPLDTPGERMTAGQALERLRASLHDTEKRADREKMDGLLQSHGLRWATYPIRPNDAAPNPMPGLYVTTAAHERLTRAFTSTVWAGQRWAAALGQLPDALAGRVVPPVKIGGPAVRAVWLPERLVDSLTRE